MRDTAIPDIGTGSPFHAGEQAVQQRAGVRDEIEPWARKVVRDHLPEQHRAFYPQLPFVVAAARDAAGRPWATLLVGEPGFVASPDPVHLEIDSRPGRGDALETAFVPGADIGLLGIELDTRRRNRANGLLVTAGPGRLVMRIGQAFGNCPQYITRRAWRRVDVSQAPAAAGRSRRLDAAMRHRLAGADTFFVASGYRAAGPRRSAFGMDASHRGGPPGFVSVVSDTRLVFPDYAGNNHFNTFGNLVEDPRIGLLFVDFERGSLLQLTGRATIDWDSPAIEKHPGARRLVTVDVEEIVSLEEALPLRWSAPGGSARSLRLVGRVRESDDVMSFEFIARDGGPLPRFRAGQHLPVEVAVPGQRAPLLRTYSLSGPPGADGYRLSVKREPRGLVSRYLHDALEVGDLVQARPPAGDFVLRDSSRPVVLAAAGIGVTPLVSMLHALAASADSRRVTFVHGVRDARHHPLKDEVAALAGRHPNLRSLSVYSRPPAGTAGGDRGDHGRVTAAMLLEHAGNRDADFYLCGPPSFMADLGSGLAEAGIPRARVHVETF